MSTPAAIGPAGAAGRTVNESAMRRTSSNCRSVTTLSRLDMTQSLDKKTYDERLEEYQGKLNHALSQGQGARRLLDPGVRGVGRGRQGRRHPPHRRGARRARLPGDPDRRADRRGAGAALPVAVLAASVAGRADDHYSIAAGTAGCWSSGSRVSPQEAEWKRAYAEINEFEDQLVEHGIVALQVLVPHNQGRATRAGSRRARESPTNAGS